MLELEPGEERNESVIAYVCERAVSVRMPRDKSPNSNIWESPCRATETRIRTRTRGHTVDGTTNGRCQGSYAKSG